MLQDVKKRNSWLVIGFLLILMIGSFVFASSPQLNSIHQFVMTNIDEMKTNVMKMLAISSVSSTFLSMLPDDWAMPLAQNIADIADYLIIVFAALWLQKYLFLSMSTVALKMIVPLGLGLSLMGHLADILDVAEDATRKFKMLGIRMALFGMILFGLVPVTLTITNSMEDFYQDTIQTTLEQSDQIQSEIDAEAKKAQGDQGQAAEDPAKDQVSKEETTEAPKDLLGQISAIVDGTVDGAAEVATGVVDATKNVVNATMGTLNQITGNIIDLPNKMMELLNNLTDSLALLIVVNCIAPLIIFAGLVWMLKLVMGAESQKIIQTFNQVRPHKKFHDKMVAQRLEDDGK